MSDTEAVVRLSDARLEPRRVEVSASGSTSWFDVVIEQYAGEAELLVEAAGDARSVLLDIAPDARKLGRDEHAALLDELQERVEGLVFGATGGRRRVAESEIATPPIALHAELRSRFRDLLAAFAAISRAPHRAVVAEREERLLHRVQRADARTVRATLRRPLVLAALRGRGSAQVTIDHPRRTETLDTPVNRHLAATLVQLSAAIERLIRAFGRWADGAGPGRDSAEVQARGRRLREEARTWADGVANVRRAQFLSGIRPVSGSTGALLAVSWHPAYRRFDRLVRAVLRPRRGLTAHGAPLSLRPTWELYELWCLFRLEAQLRAEWPDASWTGLGDFPSGDLLVDVGQGQRVSVGQLPDGGLVELYNQPTFPSYSTSRAPDQRTSITMELRPDFVVRNVPPPGSADSPTYRVIDAKYRTSRSAVHDALRAAHVYRDALRWGGVPPTSVVLWVPRVHSEVSVYASAEYVSACGIGLVAAKPAGLASSPSG